MRGKLLLAVVLVFALGVTALAAAAPPGEEEAAPPKPCPVREYFADRGKDLLDIFNLKLLLGDGKSFLIHGRATRFAQIGFGRFVGTKIGFDGPCAGIYGEGRIDYGFSIFYWSQIGRKTNDQGISADAKKRNWFFSKVEDIKDTSAYREFYDGNRPWHTVGGSVAMPFLPGIEAELNPAEAMDFLLSWFSVPGLRVPPPFYMQGEIGERYPAQGCIRWHGQEAFEQYE
jgi:hypothetical protein